MDKGSGWVAARVPARPSLVAAVVSVAFFALITSQSDVATSAQSRIRPAQMWTRAATCLSDYSLLASASQQSVEGIHEAF